jgi:hypothetical protein
MERLKAAMEDLDQAISDLEDKIGLDSGHRRDNQKKLAEQIKQIRAREASVLGVAQKVASRLDHSIEHLETILRH